MREKLDANQLPSYGEATSQDHWTLVAPYVSSQDLCSASLACSRWHEIFTPQLWGDPASHFGTADDSVYVSLTRFRRTLPWARLYVRQMTHTLHMPPAHAELYEGPHEEWLRDMIERLPRLQSLVVDALPFFDHGCLMALRRPLNVQDGPLVSASASHMRLLKASHCSNATYSGLAAALRQFSKLMYLNLSGTSAARHPTVLQTVEDMTDLQVLKIDGTGLTDNHLSVLAKCLGLRTRSLDVGHNSLTDASVRSLMKHCIRNNHYDRQLHQREVSYESLPLAPGGDMLTQYYGESLNTHLQERLTNGFAQRLAIQNDENPGLTHLYISANQLTVEGVAALLSQGSLQCLDAGETVKKFDVPKSPTSPHAPSGIVEGLPGAEKLVDMVRRTKCDKLTYLRINHEFVTKEAAVHTAHKRGQSELPANATWSKPAGAQELDIPTVHELHAETRVGELDSTPVTELDADHLYPTETNGSPEKHPSPANEERVPMSPPRRGSVYAPEACQNGKDTMDKSRLAPPSLGERTYSGIVKERKSRAAYQRAYSTHFTPSFLPRLHTLVLCGVPEKSLDRTVSNNLIRLIKLCSQESNLAKEEASQSYMHPPGRSQKTVEREYVKSVFALERVVIELASPAVKDVSRASWRAHATSKASTEDPDSEAFWDAAQQDFTFFDEEECGQPVEKGQSLPSWYMDPVLVHEGASAHGVGCLKPPQQSQDVSQEPGIDVIAEVSEFRRARKAAKEARIASGFPDDPVEGFWDGQIQVIRAPSDPHSGEAKDVYGNVFEKGFRYR